MLNAKGDSCANPTAGGLNLNTEYTFFKNESPTTQYGGPTQDAGMEENAPTHIESFPSNPVLKSAGDICHCSPPNDMLTVTGMRQGIIQFPLIFPVPLIEPGTCAYI